MTFSFENTVRRFPSVLDPIIMWEVRDKTAYMSKSILHSVCSASLAIFSQRCFCFDGKLGVSKGSSIRFDVDIVGMETPVVEPVGSQISYIMARCEYDCSHTDSVMKHPCSLPELMRVNHDAHDRVWIHISRFLAPVSWNTSYCTKFLTILTWFMINNPMGRTELGLSCSSLVLISMWDVGLA